MCSHCLDLNAYFYLTGTIWSFLYLLPSSLGCLHILLPQPQSMFSCSKNWATCLWGESSALFHSHLFFFFGISEACYAQKCFHSSWTIKSIITAVCIPNMNGNEWQRARQTFSFDLPLVIEIFLFCVWGVPFPSPFISQSLPLPFSLTHSLILSLSFILSLSPSSLSLSSLSLIPEDPMMFGHILLLIFCSCIESNLQIKASPLWVKVTGEKWCWTIITLKSLLANLWAWLLLHRKKHSGVAFLFTGAV